MSSTAGASSTRSTFAPARRAASCGRWIPARRNYDRNPRRRAVGQPRHLDHRQRRARHRDRQGDRQDRLGQEPARPAGQWSCPRRRSRSRTTSSSAPPAATGRARLDRLARSENRQPEMEDLRHPGARRARQRNLEGQEQRLADRRRRVLRHRLLRSADQPDLLGLGQSGAGLRCVVPAGRQPLHQQRDRVQCRERQDGVVLPVHAERQPRLRRDRHATSSSTPR